MEGSTPIHLTLWKRKGAEEPNFNLRAYLKQFASLKSTLDKINFVYDDLEKHSLPVFRKDKKCDITSMLHRHCGNKFYERAQYGIAMDCYTNSVFTAETKETMALAFANRSAVLLKLNLFEECLTDINRALECGYEDKAKLVLRQKYCKSLTFLTRAKAFEDAPKISNVNKSRTIRGAKNCVEIKKNGPWGRHVVATKVIDIGEVIAIQKPFALQLVREEPVYCYECLQLCYTTIPCENCTQVIYCSPKCRETAFKTYHQYECSILLSIGSITEVKHKVCLPLKMIFKTAAAPDKTFRPDRLEEIFSLETHLTDNNINLFAKIALIAGVVRLVKLHTDFFNNVTCSDTLFKESLLKLSLVCDLNSAVIKEYVHDGGPEMRPVAKALYPFYGFFNHSCDNNIAQQFHGTTLVLRAINTIKKGEECFVNYDCSYLSDSMEFRKGVLFQHYFFKCTCEACVNKWQTFSILDYTDCNLCLTTYITCMEVACVLDLVLAEEPDVHWIKRALPNVIAYARKAEKDKSSSKNYSLAKYALLMCYNILGNRR